MPKPNYLLRDSKVATKMNWKAAGTLITLAILGAGIVATFATGSAKQEEIGKDLTTLKEDGCDLSGTNEKTMIGMGKDVEVIRGLAEDNKEDLKEMRKEQRAGFKEIMTELRER